MVTDGHAFIRYLEAKKTIDDRSLNHHVFCTMKDNVERLFGDNEAHILEAGCGVGSMIERIIDWEVVRHVSYCGIDLSRDCIAHARKRLEDYGRKKGMVLQTDTDGRLVLHSHAFRAGIELQAGDVMGYASTRARAGSFGLLIAHAFLDLVDLYSSLPLLLSLVSAKGLLYFTLNFDGVTSFEPTVDGDLDRHIIALYHDTMDHRLISGKQSGDSKTGRHLLPFLVEAGLTILDAGASDWVIYPTHGSYNDDDEYFLHFIVDTICSALKPCQEISHRQLNKWATSRHDQIKLGRLFYIAHQIDVLAQIPCQKGTI